MYRHILPLLLCHAVAGAPKALSDSDITYVKIQPPVEMPAAPKHSRESRIENLPLTIPGIVTLERTDPADNLAKNNSTVERNLSENGSETLSDSDLILPESSDLSEVTALPETGLVSEEPLTIGAKNIGSVVDDPEKTQTYQNIPELSLADQNLPESQVDQILPEKSQADRILPETSQADQILPETAQAEQILPEKSQADETLPEKSDELLEAHQSDVIPAETNQSERRGRNYDSSETTDIFEEQTAKYEDVTQITEAPRTKAKYIPKLSYLKPQVYSFSVNSLEKATKRRFRSHCRCEKIWNCPKLQISVPRCPNEYFLCCF